MKTVTVKLHGGFDVNGNGRRLFVLLSADNGHVVAVYKNRENVPKSALQGVPTMFKVTRKDYKDYLALAKD